MDIEPAYQGTPLEAGLVQLKIADPAFSAARFLEGAAKAFELIVAAYAKNDTDALKPLLSAEVYSRFASTIQDREARHETMETELVVLKPPKLESVGSDRRARPGERAVSKRTGQYRQGFHRRGDRRQPRPCGKRHRCLDLCPRHGTSRDPNWALVATRSIERCRGTLRMLTA